MLGLRYPRSRRRWQLRSTFRVSMARLHPSKRDLLTTRRESKGRSNNLKKGTKNSALLNHRLTNIARSRVVL